jgi:pyrimidine-nucleoside phosphorylase
MDPLEVVATKRDGGPVSQADLEAFIAKYAEGDVSEELAAAFLMAVYIHGLDEGESVALTRALIASGGSVSLEGVSRPTVDKHSTGGVADGVTLVFAPLAAAVGLGVAKLSGRGLGHTGGTLDKIESIPGFRTDLSADELVRHVERVGCAIAGQGPDLVPADGKLYALREATATIDSIPLLAASVMCKKLAVGTELILLDVKAGRGAFMKTADEAVALADRCVALAGRWDRRARAAVTDMSQPLGTAIGNALDVAEAVEVLADRTRGRLREVALSFVVQALVGLTGASEEAALSRAEGALSSGQALECFGRMVEAQGGDRNVVDRPWDVLPKSSVRHPVVAPDDGFLASVDAEALGKTSVFLGAGRVVKGAPVDPAVGIVFRPKIGDRVEVGGEVGSVHARGEEVAEAAVRRVLEAMTLSEQPITGPPLVYGWRESGL